MCDSVSVINKENKGRWSRNSPCKDTVHVNNYVDEMKNEEKICTTCVSVLMDVHTIIF